MATGTYAPIASITLGSSATSVTFSSIPQDYRDLVLVIDAATTNARGVGLQFNSDTTAHYSFVQALGDGSTTNSNSGTSLTYARTISTTSSSSLGVVSIMDYSATDKHKTVLTKSSETIATRMMASRWPDTSAVTTMTVMNNLAENFLTGSTFALWGIAS